ncbi:MAG: hypothetical protein HYY22_03120 [Thaumarchaeota archaeon]|nr:hypothetical protein [Nitrososphaerota archaeon]
MNMKTFEVEKDVARRLRALLPNLESLSSQPPSAGFDRGFDFYGKDSEGNDYFIEVKARRCNRIDIGQIVEQASAVQKKHPNAKAVLVCASIDPAVGALLEKAGIKTLLLADLKPKKPVAHEGKEKELNLSPTEQQAYFALIRNEKKIISTNDLASLLDIPVERARNLLVSLNKHQAVFRFGRGKFAVIPPDILYERKSYTADPYLIIDSIMSGEQYYVAYGSAAHLHGIATQLPVSAFIATLKQQRPIHLNGTEIRFITAAKPRFFGIEQQEYFGAPLQISDLERTVIDCIDRPDLVGGIDEAARVTAESLQRLDFDKLVNYAKKMKRQSLVQRLGFILEKLSKSHYTVPAHTLNQLKLLVQNAYPYPLDPKRGKKGALSPHWHIYENVDNLRWHFD